MNFLWLDLETTGLDETKCGIIQVGVILTDTSLNELGHGEWLVNPDDAVWEPEARLMHEKSGLGFRALMDGSVCSSVEFDLCQFIKTYGGSEKPVMAGNSIHFDRRFLAHHMPGPLALLHHRMLDVSVFKVLRDAWGLPKVSRDVTAHTALADLEASIAQFKLDKQTFFPNVGPELASPTLTYLNGPKEYEAAQVEAIHEEEAAHVGYDIKDLPDIGVLPF